MRRLIALTAAAAAASIVTASVAAAQPSRPPPPGYYSEPPGEPGGFHGRYGLAIGFGLGLGGMEADSGPIECFDCDYNLAAGSLDFHIGGMINPRTAVLFEVWGTAQSLDSGGIETLVQSMAMVAVQHWLTPQLWLKGGLGVAHLTLNIDTGRVIYEDTVDTGLGLMAALGYEVFSADVFAIDLSLRLGSASYDGIRDRVGAGVLGVGFNWY